jgi:hypothetical protein
MVRLSDGYKQVARAARSAPVMRFALLGAVLFVADRWRTGTAAEPQRPVIVVAAADATRAAEAIDDAVLAREALARGLDRDRVVRGRLVRLGRYLGLRAEDSDKTVEREARALGLASSDRAIRRHLVEMMRLAIARPTAADMPTETELRASYAEHAAALASPPRYRLSQVFVDPARRGAAAGRDAAALLAALRAGRAAAAPPLGDPFVRGTRIGWASAAALDAAFGAGFGAAIAALPVGEWGGPIRSSYGLHLVRVEEIQPGSAPSFEAVRNRLVHTLLRSRSAARLEETLRALRTRYDVRVVSAAAPATDDADRTDRELP